jgi:glycosyltransferase involved in cell wall biosynthesis
MISKKQKIKRILYVSEKAGFFGGVERYIYDTAQVLKKAGWEIYMMYSEEALDVEKFLKIFNGNFRKDDIDKLIAEEDFDLAVIFKVNDPTLVSKLRLAFKTSVCVSDHDYYCLRHHKYFPIGRINCPLPSNLIYCSICNMGRGRMFNYASLLNEIRKCDSFIVLSEFMRNNLIKNGFNEKDIFKIYPVCQLPTKKINKQDFPKTPVIMFAGQLIRGKGVDLLLYALARIERKFKAVIVGDGKDMEFLKALAVKLGIDEKVKFMGWQDNVSRFWTKADIAVFPSRWQEPFGLTGIEAFSHKLPVVGFDVGGVTEWLHNGENGLAVPSKDVTALYVELEYLLGQPEIAIKMGENGYKFVAKEFTPAKFISTMNAMVKKTRRKNV